ATATASAAKTSTPAPAPTRSKTPDRSRSPRAGRPADALTAPRSRAPALSDTAHGRKPGSALRASPPSRPRQRLPPARRWSTFQPAQLVHFSTGLDTQIRTDAWFDASVTSLELCRFVGER